LGEVAEFLDALNYTSDLFVKTTVDLVLDCLLLTSGINLLFELLVATLELVEGVQGLIELVFLQLDLVGISLDHDLFDLILLDVLVNSILFGGLERWKFIETVSSSCHVVTIKRDTKSLTHLRIIDFEDVPGFLLFKILLGLLDLTSKYHQALLLVLELLGEAVSFTLKALGLTFIHSSLAHA